eukprot:5035256-Amphidinium_carterae.1
MLVCCDCLLISWVRVQFGIARHRPQLPVVQEGTGTKGTNTASCACVSSKLHAADDASLLVQAVRHALNMSVVPVWHLVNDSIIGVEKAA